MFNHLAANTISHAGLPSRSRCSGSPVAGERRRVLPVLATLALVLLAALAGDAAAEIRASYQYHLSDFWGAVPYQWAALTLDRDHNEVYALDPQGADLRVFNDAGMEVHDFGEGQEVSHPIAVAVGEDGDLFFLTRAGASRALHRCDYRGVRLGEIEITGLPDTYSAFRPSRIETRKGLLYLADITALQIVVVERSGQFVRGYDIHDVLLRRLMDSRRVDEKALKELKGLAVEMGGFSVDRSGNIYFTVPVWFIACRLTANGQLEEFGMAGSGTGKFGVAAGIVADDHGFIYVTDHLRCVVMVFSSDLEFQTEFGYRGAGPANLVVPDDVEIDGHGQLYVSQAANRGVSVFRIEGN